MQRFLHSVEGCLAATSFRSRHTAAGAAQVVVLPPRSAHATLLLALLRWSCCHLVPLTPHCCWRCSGGRAATSFRSRHTAAGAAQVVVLPPRSAHATLLLALLRWSCCHLVPLTPHCRWRCSGGLRSPRRSGTGSHYRDV